MEKINKPLNEGKKIHILTNFCALPRIILISENIINTNRFFKFYIYDVEFPYVPVTIYLGVYPSKFNNLHILYKFYVYDVKFSYIPIIVYLEVHPSKFKMTKFTMEQILDGLDFSKFGIKKKKKK